MDDLDFSLLEIKLKEGCFFAQFDGGCWGLFDKHGAGECDAMTFHDLMVQLVLVRSKDGF